MPSKTYKQDDIIEATFIKHADTRLVGDMWFRFLKVRLPDGTVVDAVVDDLESLPDSDAKFRARVGHTIFHRVSRPNSLDFIPGGEILTIERIESPPGANSLFLSAEDAAAIAAFWRENGYRKIEHREDGVWIKTARKSYVQVEPLRVTFHGKAARDPTAIITALKHIKENWGTSCLVHGSEEFKQEFWTQARLLSIRVANYEPPPEIKERVDRWVADREAARAGLGPKKPPPRRRPQHEAHLGL